MKKHNMQQQTPEWHQIKLGVVSGTQAKGLMGTPKARQESIYDIVGERLKVTDEEYENEHPIARGNRLEEFAIGAYEEATGTQVERVGFCEHDSEQYLGNSPDGLVGDFGAIEVKCPEHKNYIKYWLENKIPDDYIWQVVQYFVVNNTLLWLDFVAYNPDIPSHPIHIIRTTRTELTEKIAELEAKEHIFIKEVNDILATLIEF